MRALLICPSPRKETACLAERAPLANLCILGKAVVEYWLEYLATKGASEVEILSADRPERVRSLVGNGARWGVRAVVRPVRREPNTAEARAKYRVRESRGWLPAPDDVRLMDHLPGLSEFPLFTCYADWIAAARAWMPRALTPDRIGVREIKPGIWVGLRARISPEADLRAPAWIGDEVGIEAGAIVGPMAIIENKSFIGRGAEVTQSVVGPETLVGEFTDVRHSIAWGDQLMNCKLGSAIRVADAFLLCSLASMESSFKPVGVVSRMAAGLALLLTLPLALPFMLRAKWRRAPLWRRIRAVRPGVPSGLPVPHRVFFFHEMVGVRGWLRRWPQLWSIVRGDMAWVGNRPLGPGQASRLTTEFESLWLATRPGLISLGDTEEGSSIFNEAAKAHAAFYSVRADWRFDVKILLRAAVLLFFGVPWSRVRELALRVQSPKGYTGISRRFVCHGDQTT